MEEENQDWVRVFRTKPLYFPFVNRNVFTVSYINAYAFCIWMYVVLLHIIVTLCGQLPNTLNRSISYPCSLGSDSRFLRSRVCGYLVDFLSSLQKQVAEFCAENFDAVAACSSF